MIKRLPTPAQIDRALAERNRAIRNTNRVIWALVLALVAFVVLVALTACEPEKGQSKFDRDCAARGGRPTTVHRGDSTSRVCVPPPAPIHQMMGG